MKNHNKFRQLFNESGLTQKRVAENFNVTNHIVYNWYAGRTQVPDNVIEKLQEFVDLKKDLFN